MNDERTVWTVLAGLALSRKFWLLLIALIGALILFAQGGIDATTLVDAIVALAGVLIASIAGEDMASKFGITRINIAAPEYEERIDFEVGDIDVGESTLDTDINPRGDIHA